MPEVEYVIDFEGRLWKGPVATDSNMRWARMEGFSDVDHTIIWVLRRSSRPETSLSAQALDEYLEGYANGLSLIRKLRGIATALRQPDCCPAACVNLADRVRQIANKLEGV